MHARRATRLSLVFLAGTGFLAGAPGAVADEQPPKDYVQTLKGIPDEAAGLKLIGADTDKGARYEPAGLRLTLPVGTPKDARTIGVATGQSVRGDFEITVRFEILKEPAPADTGNFGARLTLTAGVEAPNENLAKIACAVRPQGIQFLAYSARWNEAAAKHDKGFQSSDRTVTQGRLRLARAGAELSFLVAEGADGEFTLLRSYPFTTAELREVRVLASVDHPRAALDARLTDLHIRTGALAANPEPAAPEPAPPAMRGWLAGGLSAVLVLVLALTFCLYLKKRR
jgi:hypothetical protein